MLNATHSFTRYANCTIGYEEFADIILELML